MNDTDLTFSFSAKLAIEFNSIDLAILIKHFQYWIIKNKALEKNFLEGKTWTYQTMEDIEAVFPIWSIDQVKRLIVKAIEKKILVKGNFNKSKFDRTLWYAFVDEERFVKDAEIKKMFPKVRNRQMESAESENGKCGIAPPIPNIITNIKTKEDKSNNIPHACAHEASTTPPSSLPQKKQKESKIAFGKVVALREGEYESLCQEMGKAKVDHYIKSIELYVPNRKEGPYKDYAAAIRTWHNRENQMGGSPIEKKSKELPQDPTDKLIENRAISERIRAIVQPLCNKTRKFYVEGHRSVLEYATPAGHITKSFNYVTEPDAIFQKEIYIFVATAFPEVKKELGEEYQKRKLK